ncbi:hypothetical protein ACFQ34_21960 [Pseudonocardia benzenivorans]|jgi:hypothetical protein|uniref:Uncharacterized protein n=1 Tax=Pseudonocardia benzenivorans TaxID=228005 RepID=A0ABW3VM17_9PSEU|nr:hypothetical protein [Pseudonocardia dioxanivorans]GJF06419.1 hypothetical protein PSD17_53660 [Pseudonocardia sp. D17]
MIRICERCFGPVAETDEHLGLAHIDRALPDGTVLWNHTYVHTAPCAPAGSGYSAHEAPNQGEWDPGRRGMSPGAAAHVARRPDDPAERTRATGSHPWV